MPGLDLLNPAEDLLFDLDAGHFVKHPVEQDGLQLVRQVGPVPPYGFHAHDLHQVGVPFAPEPRVSLGPAPFAVPPHRRKQKPVVVLFHFQLKVRCHAVPVHDVPGQPGVDPFAYPASEAQRLNGRGMVRRLQIHEHRIGVPIQHPVTVLLQLVAAPFQDIVPEFRDRAGQLRRGKAAGRRRQHAVERIHDDLVGEGSEFVAGGLRLVPAIEELLQHGGQDAGRAGEPRAVGGFEVVLRPFVFRPVTRYRVRYIASCLVGLVQYRSLRLDMRQRIDVEGPDDGRVEAFEVEDEHISVKTGFCGYDQPARCAGAGGAVHAGRRRHHAALMQRADVDVVEGGHAHPRPFQGQARQQSPAQGQVDQPFRFQDGEHQPGVLQAVGAERGPVLAIDFRDLLRPGTPAIFLEQLAPSQDGVGHRVQPIILEPLQRTAKQVKGVQDLAAVNHHGAPAPDLARSVPGLVVGPSELERDVQVFEAPLQHAQIEIDQVPSGEQIGVHFEYAG